MLGIHSRETGYFSILILHFTTQDISCLKHRTLSEKGVKWYNTQKIKLSLLEGCSIKFEALLVVISLNVVDMNASRLNNKITVQSFYVVSTRYSKNFTKK